MFAAAPMKEKSRRHSLEGSWPKIVLKKWLNINTKNSDFSADEYVDTGSEFDGEERCERIEERRDERRINRLISHVNTSANSSLKRHRRRNSETLRTQYIDTKELRIRVGTWNVGGKHPRGGSEIEEWLDKEEPADIYILGLQEIVPLNAGNVLGAEDNRPIPRWESMIREALNRMRSPKPSFKCHSDPPSPSRFKPSNDAPPIEDEILSETDSGSEEEIYPLDHELNVFKLDNGPYFGSRYESECIQTSKIDRAPEFDLEQKVYDSPKKLSRLNHFNLTEQDLDIESFDLFKKPSLARLLSNSERIGLIWPEKPLDLENQICLLHAKSFKAAESFKNHSFRPFCGDGSDSLPDSVPGLEKLASMGPRRSLSFVKIIGKQMVGIFLSVWVQRGLRKHIQNVKVSTVGVGIMGYIGNKGSIAVSMSIHQTHFCFICCHLSAGEKEGDVLRRNSDVRDIHRRTIFNVVTNASFPKIIYDHERIIWLGDLNYRINLSYERTHELISKQEWSKLAEFDQLKHELDKGCAFDGWTEGDLNFAPTYKYEINSTKYVGGDLKGSRRTPAWCDRILSFGKGMRLLSYKRSELSLSDHRPVSATFMSEIEVFCHRKLQRALTLTDAEIEAVV